MPETEHKEHPLTFRGYQPVKVDDPSDTLPSEYSSSYPVNRKSNSCERSLQKDSEDASSLSAFRVLTHRTIVLFLRSFPCRKVKWKGQCQARGNSNHTEREMQERYVDDARETISTRPSFGAWVVLSSCRSHSNTPAGKCARKT